MKGLRALPDPSRRIDPVESLCLDRLPAEHQRRARRPGQQPRLGKPPHHLAGADKHDFDNVRHRRCGLERDHTADDDDYRDSDEDREVTEETADWLVAECQTREEEPKNPAMRMQAAITSEAGSSVAGCISPASVTYSLGPGSGVRRGLRHRQRAASQGGPQGVSKA